MRVCYFGTYREEYSRNKIMIAGLRANGVDVVECHETLWQGVDDRVAVVSGGWLKPAFWWRVVRTYTRLLKKYYKVGNYDVMVVGYPGQFDMFLARFLTKLRRRPLVWDVLMSIYQVAIERKLDAKNPKIVSFLKKIEQKGCNLADKLIIESRYYAQWFKNNQSISIEKFAYVPLGAYDNIFYPQPCSQTNSESGIIKILYYGSFLPSHGVDNIIEAAEKLQNKAEYRFILVGEGPELKRIKERAKSLPNVIFTGYLSLNDLQRQIACADICIGVFGTTPQALMTIQNKIFECLAMQKTLLTGDSEPVREVLTHLDNCYICCRDADSIAKSILELGQRKELRIHLAERGYQLFCKQYSVSVIGRILKDVLQQVLLRYGN